MSSPAFLGSQPAQDVVHDPVHFVRLTAYPIVVNPTVKVFSFDEQFPFHSMIGQRVCSIGQTIAQPAHRTARVGREGLEIKITRCGDRLLH